MRYGTLEEGKGKDKFLRKLWVGSYITEPDIDLKEWSDILSQVFKIIYIPVFLNNLII